MAAGERLDQTGILRQVGDAAKLDLVVVGDEEDRTRARNERLAELATRLGTHRDVVEVRSVGAESARAGDRLVERGVDAAVGLDLGEQAGAVGAPQLLDLAVGQQVVDDGVLVAQLLQHTGIGHRLAGLGLLEDGQTELLEQDRPELLGGVDVELLARLLDDEGAEPVALRLELFVEPLELGAVDADAEVLHAGERRDERVLHLVGQLGEALGVERRGDGLDHERHPERLACRIGGDRLGGAVEVELPGLGGAALREFELGVAVEQLGRAVPGVGGVEEVRGDLHVGVQARQRTAVVEQTAQQRLGVVGDDRRTVGEQRVERRGGASEQVGGNP